MPKIQKIQKKDAKFEPLKSDEYQALMFAMDEEDILMEEIEKLIENSNNREELEKIIEKKYVPLLKKSRKKTQKAFVRWRMSIKEEIQKAEAVMSELDN